MPLSTRLPSVRQSSKLPATGQDTPQGEALPVQAGRASLFLAPGPLGLTARYQALQSALAETREAVAKGPKVDGRKVVKGNLRLSADDLERLEARKPVRLTSGDVLTGGSRPPPPVALGVLDPQPKGKAWTLAYQARQEALIAELSPVRDFLFAEGRHKEWRAQERCIREAYPLRLRCQGCQRYHVHLLGGCKRRACKLCHLRPGRERAVTYRDRLGPADHLFTVVSTMPPESCEGLTPRDFTPLANKVAKSIEEWSRPWLPAGIICAHWAGDEDPRKMHLHWNIVMSNRLMHSREDRLLRIRERTFELWEVRSFIAATVARLGVHPLRSQGRQYWRAKIAEQSHAMRYIFRSQGCGDDLARWKWTLPEARTNRPFGALATGRRSRWKRLNPWTSEAQRNRALGIDPDSLATILDSAPQSCEGCGSELVPEVT